MLRFLQQAVRTGKASLVYEAGEIRQFVQEKGFWCTNRVNSGEIAPQRDGGGERYATGGAASADMVQRQRGFQENRSSGATGRNIVKAVCP